MNRRAFFGALAGLAATATMDPERLLWVPGKKLISIPKPVEIPIWERRFVFLTKHMTVAEFRQAYPGHALLNNLVHHDAEAPMQALVESGREDGKLRLVEWWINVLPPRPTIKHEVWIAS